VACEHGHRSSIELAPKQVSVKNPTIWEHNLNKVFPRLPSQFWIFYRREANEQIADNTDLNGESLSLKSPLRNLWFRKYWEYTYSRKLPSGYTILHILAGSRFYQLVKRFCYCWRGAITISGSSSELMPIIRSMSVDVSSYLLFRINFS